MSVLFSAGHRCGTHCFVSDRRFKAHSTLAMGCNFRFPLTWVNPNNGFFFKEKWMNEIGISLNHLRAFFSVSCFHHLYITCFLLDSSFNGRSLVQTPPQFYVLEQHPFLSYFLLIPFFHMLVFRLAASCRIWD
ncbi:hypothetical protein SAY87_012000 [Trapa incisa]|uniref:Uncharacterized protein n=1 Tax=Trapa incisa TaxID=236973 RepID=A0AAN7JJS3_9MYRT|nr:hypothetical protein SAY87_012000 [Trapa incisa]